MDKNTILKELSLDIEEASTSSFKSNLEEAKKLFSKKELIDELSKILLVNYTSYKEDGISYFLEIILKSDVEFGIIDEDQNKFFRLAVLKGSMKLLECLFEEAYTPYFSDKDEDEKFDFNANLSITAYQIDELVMDNSKKVYKGLDFNGGYLDQDRNMVVINPEDFHKMDSICELYNAMVGRKEVIKFLEKL
jgi:hypothetical protein